MRGANNTSWDAGPQTMSELSVTKEGHTVSVQSRQRSCLMVVNTNCILSCSNNLISKSLIVSLCRLVQVSHSDCKCAGTHKKYEWFTKK